MHERRANWLHLVLLLKELQRLLAQRAPWDAEATQPWLDLTGALLQQVFALEGAIGLVSDRHFSGRTPLFPEAADPSVARSEGVIAIVLLGALGLAARSPERTRTFGLAAQGFALVGTLIGTYRTAIVGLGTVPDVVYHLTILVVLASGLVVAARSGSGPRERPSTHPSEPAGH